MMADNKRIMRLLKTARGQIDGIIKMIEEDRYCIDVSNQIMATSAILRKANKEIIRAHMKCCVKEAFESGNEDEKINEFIEIIDKISK